MKFNSLFISFLTLLCSFNLFAYDVGVPLHSFLFEANSRRAMNLLTKNAGWLNTITQGLGFEKQFYKNLHKSCPIQPKPFKAFLKGEEVPEYIYQSFFGNIPSAQLLQTVKNDFMNRHVKNLDAMLSLAEIAFDPAMNAHVLDLTSGADKFVKKLLSKGHRVFIIDNCNQEVKQMLKQKFPLLSSLPMMVSGEIHMIKSPAFYTEFMNKFALNPANTIFIETEEPYIGYIQQAVPNAKTILCKHKGHPERNISQAKDALKDQYGINLK